MINTSHIYLLNLSEFIDDLGHEKRSQDYFIPKGISNISINREIFRPAFYGIILCTKGHISIEVNDYPLCIEENGLFIMGPSQIITKISLGDTSEMTSIFFTRQLFTDGNISGFQQFEALHHFPHPFYSVASIAKEDLSLISSLHSVLVEMKDINHFPFNHNIVKHLIGACLNEIVRIYCKAGLYESHFFGKRGLQTYVDFKKLVREHCASNRQIQFYADMLFVTPKNLIGIVKRNVGKTPKEVIDEELLAIAKVELTKIDNTVAMIADILCFSDLASFSKYFKKHTGVSPLAYRERNEF